MKKVIRKPIWKVIDRNKNPIFLAPATDGNLELRIGGYKRGSGRTALLTTGEARLLAYALLHRVEKCTLATTPSVLSRL